MAARMRSIWIGHDPREWEAYDVCSYSIRRRLSSQIKIEPVSLPELQARGLYTRPTGQRDGRLWDDISQAPMSTEFAISRFLVPTLAKKGWALFMDCDMLVLSDLARVFDIVETLHSDKALVCVWHNHQPTEQQKMDGQSQQRYVRKNWSSFMLFNCDHPSNRELLVPAVVNAVPGRALHRFFWLRDDEIGALNPAWNFLVGHNTLAEVPQPHVIHYTSGGPWFKDFKSVPFSEEWNRELTSLRSESSSDARTASGTSSPAPAP